MSISVLGSDSRNASDASSVCPPASSFASGPAALHSRNTSASEAALT